MKKVLVVWPVEERHKVKLEAAGLGCAFRYIPASEVTEEDVSKADILLGNVPASFLSGAEHLGLFQLNSAGADPYIKPGVLHEGTVLCNASGAYSKAVAEHGLALLLMLQKKLEFYRDAQREAKWSDFGTVTSIADATVAVVGLGDIGGHFARMAKALGARVIGLRRRPGEKPDYVDELTTIDHLDEVLPQVDAVFSVLPGGPATRHLYTAERFRRMKKSAIFINCGRGSAVAPQVLYEALTNGDIAAAGIDVVDPEPLPSDSPLWALQNLMLTPHISGDYHLPETFERIVDIAADNLGRYLRGEKLRNIVNPETGYRDEK